MTGVMSWRKNYNREIAVHLEILFFVQFLVAWYEVETGTI